MCALSNTLSARERHRGSQGGSICGRRRRRRRCHARRLCSHWCTVSGWMVGVLFSSLYFSSLIVSMIQMSPIFFRMSRCQKNVGIISTTSICPQLPLLISVAILITKRMISRYYVSNERNPTLGLIILASCDRTMTDNTVISHEKTRNTRLERARITFPAFLNYILAGEHILLAARAHALIPGQAYPRHPGMYRIRHHIKKTLF
ncbi:hypothetical protein F4778DRAFT_118902 [Xylariomycetidae sp. FL2044]|nr:hypothetical protein F4778DRAFT_118902 [Xylariomycetidae sp. FL2044]